MRSRATTSALLIPIAIVALCAARVPAQTGVESNLPEAGFGPQAAAPTIHVYSRETIVNVLVTDDKGQPVRGLTRSDFTVEEDGHSHPIRSFYEYDKTTPSTPVRTLPPDTYTNATALPTSGPVQILYFDIPCICSFPPGSDPIAAAAVGSLFVRAKKYIADYLRTMPAGTQSAVFAYRCDYGLHPAPGLYHRRPAAAAAAVDDLVSPVRWQPPGFDPIAAADQTAAYTVAGIHGRKPHLDRPAPAFMRNAACPEEWPPDMAIVHRLMDTYDTFTREQIAIAYPFDPPGVQGAGWHGHSPRRRYRHSENSGGAAIYNTNDYKGAVAKSLTTLLPLLHPLLHSPGDDS